MGRMARFGAWSVKNAGGVIALILAVVGVIVGFDDLISNATLLVLALVTTSLLRDRWRQEPMEEVIQRSFRTTSGR